MVEEAEINAVQIESSHTLSVDSFVDRASIPAIYFDTPYYLTPADKASQEAFAVIREAMSRQKKAGLARIVLFRRERPVMIEPFENALLLTTLRYEKTVRKPEDVLGAIPEVKLDPDLIDLATHIIAKKDATFDPSSFDDRYEDALLDLIEAKKKGKKLPKAQPAERPANVVNLFDALKRSLGSDAAVKKGKPELKSGRKAAPSRKKAS